MYQEQAFRLIMLASDNIIRSNIVDEDHSFNEQYRENLNAYLGDYLGGGNRWQR